MPTRRSYLVALTAGVVGLAGCGSGESGSTDRTDEAPPTATPSGGDATTSGDTTGGATPTATKTPALEPSTPVPTAPEGELPNKAALRARYSRFTAVERSRAVVELVGSDLRADFDRDSADLTLLAADFLSGKDAMENNIFDRVDRAGVSLPARGERRRLAFEVDMLTDSYDTGAIQYFLLVREPGAPLSEATQVCESNRYDARQGNFERERIQSPLEYPLEDRTTENYRRYVTEGYYLTAVKTTTLDDREFVFEYPVFRSTYVQQRDQRASIRQVHSSAAQSSAYRRALRQAAGGQDARRQLLAGMALHRSLPDVPSQPGGGYNSERQIRTLEEVLVDGGGTIRDISLGITAAASIAGYDTALIEPTDYAAAGIAGGFNGFSVELQSTPYYYVEPAARTPVGEVNFNVQQRYLTGTTF